MWDMMHPSLTTIIVTSPESRSLLMLVALGIVGLAAGILILEALAYYWFPDDTVSRPVSPWSVKKESKKLKSLLRGR